MMAKSLTAPAVVADAYSSALMLGGLGLQVFRVRPGEKLPFDADWARGGATSDIMDISDKFIGGSYNIGVLCTGLVVVDVDVKGAVNGFHTIERLGLKLPDTLTVRTGSGGVHYYFRADGFGQRPLGPGVDIRATNGYVVGPGSVVKGQAYVITNDAPVAPLPAELAAMLRATREKKPRERSTWADVGTLDTPLRKQNVRVMLRDELPAREGERNNRAYAVACKAIGLGVSSEVCFDLMAHWNDRNLPPLDDEELENVIRSAWERGPQPGSEDPGEGFEPIRVIQPAPALLEFPRDLSVEKIAALQQRALVKGLFLPGETGTVYGDSGSGKSFVTLDLAFHIALGLPWVGRKVTKSPVLYVALEGVGGFQKRVIAAARQFGDPGDYFARLNLQVSLVKAKAGAEGARKVIDGFKGLAERTGATNGLIIIDTLARATAGDDENAVADMMAFLEHRAQVIAQETGAAVLIVHHTNKRGEERGSGSLRAGVEFALRVDRDGDRRTVTGEKVKDGVEGKLYDFRLEQVALGTDADGDEITSCTVKKSDPELADRAKRCQAACLFLIEEAEREGVNLSDRKRAGDTYVANWIRAHAPDWTLQEIEAAIFVLTGSSIDVQEYRSGPGGKSGPYARRYVLTSSSGSVAVAVSSGSLSGKPQ